ncbi:hypothetical protein L218DRAFT_1008510 [Marasmius fiardii PR-910]|nr:hypothetical protein L218DRAFT_1008510 [Marasmius fiardii PR-910]
MGELRNIMTWIRNTAETAQETHEAVLHIVNTNSHLLKEVVALKTQNSKVQALQTKLLEEVCDLRKHNEELSTLLTNRQNPQPNNTSTHTAPTTTTALGPTYKPTQTVKPQPTKTTTRPTEAHHPSRLVVNFLLKGIPAYELEDPPLVVATKYNKQNSSLIIHVREDQKAADLLPFREEIRQCVIGCNAAGYHVEIHGDDQWFKIQVDNVPTEDYHRNIYTPQILMNKLTKNNSTVAKLAAEGRITMALRWMRNPEDLKAQDTRRSSFVFATSLEEAANQMIKARSLAVLGRYCDI